MSYQRSKHTGESRNVALRGRRLHVGTFSPDDSGLLRANLDDAVDLAVPRAETEYELDRMLFRSIVDVKLAAVDAMDRIERVLASESYRLEVEMHRIAATFVAEIAQ